MPLSINIRHKDISTNKYTYRVATAYEEGIDNPCSPDRNSLIRRLKISLSLCNHHSPKPEHITASPIVNYVKCTMYAFVMTVLHTYINIHKEPQDIHSLTLNHSFNQCETTSSSNFRQHVNFLL